MLNRLWVRYEILGRDGFGLVRLTNTEGEALMDWCFTVNANLSHLSRTFLLRMKCESEGRGEREA